MIKKYIYIRIVTGVIVRRTIIVTGQPKQINKVEMIIMIRIVTRFIVKDDSDRTDQNNKERRVQITDNDTDRNIKEQNNTNGDEIDKHDDNNQSEATSEGKQH